MSQKSKGPGKHHGLALAFAFLVAIAAVPFAAEAQTPPYGAPVNLEQAKKAIAAARAEATKNNWNVAIAVVDTHGFLVAYERIDDTHTASTHVAIDKAASAAMYRRPTKVFEDAVAAAGVGLRSLNLRGASAVEGGLPLVVGGKASAASAPQELPPTTMASSPRPALTQSNSRTLGLRDLAHP